ncbi:hypothetical protein B0H16DRAFT_1580939 [Mycena metata]|uniref:Uncharacterized protein n=1 Tax=Mycena metata TaxID=1033252 RepID=A0AAD7I1K5_9AGAR|nr:hypothetical protein B0H16DRAFT_1580939 [Mycena metata]
MCAEFAPRRHIRRALQIPHRRRPHPRPPPSPPPSTTRPSTMTAMRTKCPAPAHRNTRRRYSSSSFKPPPPRARICWRVWCVCRRLFFSIIFPLLVCLRLPATRAIILSSPSCAPRLPSSTRPSSPFLPFCTRPRPRTFSTYPSDVSYPLPPHPPRSFLILVLAHALTFAPAPSRKPHNHSGLLAFFSLPTSPILAPLYPLLAPPLSPSSLARLLISKLTTLVQVRSATS